MGPPYRSLGQVAKITGILAKSNSDQCYVGELRETLVSQEHFIEETCYSYRAASTTELVPNIDT